jgi:hypothetical protein
MGIVYPVIVKGPADLPEREVELKRYVEEGGPRMVYNGETYAIIGCCDSWKAADELAERIKAEGWGDVIHTHMTEQTFERVLNHGSA